ncbi:MAG: YbaK/EbsC family protein [Actinobacteria bacterium]|nr:YbaK/EbsC family protein [Actinomycetota bacterium]
MEEVLSKAAVQRVRAAIAANSLPGEIKVLNESARTAAEAATALGVEVGQTLVFRLPDGAPLLIITSGRHRVDTKKVASALGVEKLSRADIDWVKSVSGFSVGGVAPIGWQSENLTTQVKIVIDEALNDYDVVWAAAGHPHAVFPTSFAELQAVTGATRMKVSAD